MEDALRSLLHERPYAEISVGDIAERATVNRATFYAHFEDKDHLAATTLRDALDRAILARLQPPAPFDAEALTRAGTAVFECVSGMMSGCARRADGFSATLGPTFQAGLEAFLLRWLEHHPEGLQPFDGASADAVANVISWGLYGAAVRWSRLAKRPEAATAASEAVRLLMR